jgi:predicted Fe-S protein YdhL (DUF1289 family)
VSDAEPQSPCIAICALDENDICVGCFRTAVEITDWFMANAEQKRDVLRLARERMEASTTIRLS